MMLYLKYNLDHNFLNLCESSDPALGIIENGKLCLKLNSNANFGVSIDSIFICIMGLFNAGRVFELYSNVNFGIDNGNFIKNVLWIALSALSNIFDRAVNSLIITMDCPITLSALSDRYNTKGSFLPSLSFIVTYYYRTDRADRVDRAIYSNYWQIRYPM